MSVNTLVSAIEEVSSKTGIQPTIVHMGILRAGVELGFARPEFGKDFAWSDEEVAQAAEVFQKEIF